MPKINLIQRKRPAIRRNPNHPEYGIIYFIGMERDDSTFYVKKVEDTGAITWTRQRGSAMAFHTENGAQHFIHAYLKSRKNIHLQQARSQHA